MSIQTRLLLRLKLLKNHWWVHYPRICPSNKACLSQVDGAGDEDVGTEARRVQRGTIVTNVNSDAEAKEISGDEAAGNKVVQVDNNSMQNTSRHLLAGECSSGDELNTPCSSNTA